MTISTLSYDGRLHRVAYPQRASKTNELGSQADIDALLGMTNLVEQHRAGERRLVASGDDYVGDHREYVLAPFAYRYPTRFSDGSFGVLSASESLHTSVHEAAYWAFAPYDDVKAPPQEVRRQYLTLRLVAESIADIRKAACPDIDPLVYHERDYTISQRLGREIQAIFPGLVYDSVRHEGGVNLGAFVPRILSDVRLEHEISLVWDGSRFNALKQRTPL